jgi:hypothetical protein
MTPLQKIVFRFFEPLPPDQAFFAQEGLITASNSYAQSQKNKGQDFIQPFDKGGVCAALAMCFAHSALVEPSEQENIAVFKDFLQRLQTQKGIEDFLKEYESIQQQYREMKDNAAISADERQAITTQLQKL